MADLQFLENNFPPDYAEKVYAGVLGKIIGVYLGRPFEGWSYEQIMAQLGEVKYYVHQRGDLALHNHLLVVTDDDISGTFTFLRALQDYSHTIDLTPAQIGQTWLNYIIENRTILWWGGLGNSTEHTAYLRLKAGIPAPQSGSQALNGNVVCEQIGAQIFIDGWGLVAPGNPALAADLARRAASVSHDGEAIFGAQVIAALIAQAFVESDLNRLLDRATALIPADSTIFRLIADLREWHAANPEDWHAARARLAAQYGYDRYPGNCHIVPNHGLVILSLLYSNGDFNLAQTIVNTCGWDTDCNAGNVGCILGVRNGLSAFSGSPDWRSPVADRLYLPTADGGRAISDAVRETDFIIEAAHALSGKKWVAPKDGARFHFSYPGSVQGFRSLQDSLTLENRPHPGDPSRRGLALQYRFASSGQAAAATPTFIPEEAVSMPGYALLASPTLHPGQQLRAALFAEQPNTVPVRAAFLLQFYGKDDALVTTYGPPSQVKDSGVTYLEWQVPELDGAPVAQVGIMLQADQPAAGSLHLDYLSWDGTPRLTFQKPAAAGTMWLRQWVNAADLFDEKPAQAFRLIQNHGRGMVITGTRQWRDYAAQATITPHLAQACGLAVRTQGLERYYALLLSSPNKARLVKRLDGETTLAEQAFDWQFEKAYTLQVSVQGEQVTALIDGHVLFQVKDIHKPLSSGGLALVCEQGHISVDQVKVGKNPLLTFL